jgi:cytochrome P450
MILHLAAHPDAVRHVLQERMEIYDKETRSSAKIRGLTGLGLLTVSGDLWRRQRRLIQPGFRPVAMAGFVERMTAATATLLERWEAHAREGRPLDLASEMMRLTYTIAGRTLLGADVSGDAGVVEEAMDVLLAHTWRRLERIADPPDWLPTPGNRRFRKALAAIDGVVYRILAERRARGEACWPDDLLTILLRTRDEETGHGMTDEQLRDEAVTLLLAGHETTANALAWTFHLLSRHPEILERLRAEAETVLGDRAPGAGDLQSLPFTEQVLRESMRLYPPIWAVERRAVVEDGLGGYRIPAGSTMVLSPWVTHRHPAFWDDPETFDPDRFSGERSAERPPLAYIPFGAGPRFCVGGHFAMVEALVVTAMVARRWRLRPVEGRSVIPLPGITLRPAGGVWVRLEE